MVRVTIVQQGAVGDTVLMVPLVRSIKAKFASDGGAAVTLVGRMNLVQMLSMHGFIEGHTSADDREHSAWFGEGGAATSWSDCDVLISMVSNGADAWAKNAERCSTAKVRCYVDPRPPADYSGHVTQWHREQLAAQGLELEAAPPPLLRSNPDGAIVVHPGSGGEAKCWPREKFLELGRALKRNGIVPTFILGEAEMERWGVKFVQDLHGEFPWYLHMGFYELAERLGRARLFLGNDSGVTHMAGMMGVPVISLFGPSNDVQWKAVGPEVQVLRAEAPEERNLEKLEVGRVLAAMMAELRKI